MKIYKYKPNDNGIILLPARHKLLSVQLQYNEPTIWAAVDEETADVPVRFWTFPTGAVVPETDLPYYFATLIGENHLVWHVFTEGKR